MKAVFLFVLVIVAVNAQIYGLKNTEAVTVPGNQANYISWAPNTVPISGNGIAGFEFEFYAQAANDVHVIFSCSKEKRPRNAIEVVLGGWGNTRSVIRSGAQGLELTNAGNRGVCDAKAPRRYNVRYVNGEMFVYFYPDVPHGWGMKARIGGFPCANAYVGLGGWDRPVKFVSTQVAVIAQGNSATYGIFPLAVTADSFEYEFETKGSNDVHVSLQCGQAGRTSNAVEVVVGGWGNSRSVIRHGTQGRELTVRSQAGVCDANYYRNMKVRVEDNNISVFVNGAKFMSAAMPKLNCPSNQYQLGIAGWDQPVAFRPVARPVALSRTSYECAEVAASKDFWYYSDLKGRAVGLLRNQPTNGGKDFGTAPAGWAACGGMVRTNGVLSHVVRNSLGDYWQTTDGQTWVLARHLQGQVDKCFVQLKTCPSGVVQAPKHNDEVPPAKDLKPATPKRPESGSKPAPAGKPSPRPEQVKPTRVVSAYKPQPTPKPKGPAKIIHPSMAPATAAPKTPSHVAIESDDVEDEEDDVHGSVSQ